MPGSRRGLSNYRAPAGRIKRSGAKTLLAALVGPGAVAYQELAHEPAQGEHVGR